MSIGLVMAILKGGKAVVMSKPVRLALARYILDGLENRKTEAAPSQESK